MGQHEEAPQQLQDSGAVRVMENNSVVLPVRVNPVGDIARLIESGRKKKKGRKKRKKKRKRGH